MNSTSLAELKDSAKTHAQNMQESELANSIASILQIRQACVSLLTLNERIPEVLPTELGKPEEEINSSLEEKAGDTNMHKVNAGATNASENSTVKVKLTLEQKRDECLDAECVDDNEYDNEYKNFNEQLNGCENKKRVIEILYKWGLKGYDFVPMPEDQFDADGVNIKDIAAIDIASLTIYYWETEDPDRNQYLDYVVRDLEEKVQQSVVKIHPEAQQQDHETREKLFLEAISKSGHICLDNGLKKEEVQFEATKILKKQLMTDLKGFLKFSGLWKGPEEKDTEKKEQSNEPRLSNVSI